MVATFLLAARFQGLGEWRAVDLYFMVGFTVLARGLANVFSGRNVLMISRKIGRGQLDHALLQPLPLWKALAAEGFSPFDLLLTVALGAGTLIWAIARLPQTHHPLWFGALALNLAASICVFVSYQYLWGVLAFWSPRGAEEVNTTSASVIESLAGYPLDAAPRAVVTVLLTVVPVGFIGWVPSRALLGMGPGPAAMLIGPGAAVVLAVLAVLVFRKGLQRYMRYGSGRYSDFGHRR